MILVINCIDEKITYKFDDLFIVTPKYKQKMKPNIIHIPLVAKVLIKNGTEIQRFMLKEPIIKSSDNNDVSIWTFDSIKDVLDEKNFKHNPKAIKFWRAKSKQFLAKSKLGLRIEENIEYRNCKIKEQIAKIGPATSNKAKWGNW